MTKNLHMYAHKHVCVRTEKIPNQEPTISFFLTISRSNSLCDFLCVLCSSKSTTTTSTFTWDCVCMCGLVGQCMHISVGGYL